VVKCLIPGKDVECVECFICWSGSSKYPCKEYWQQRYSISAFL